MAAIGKLWAGAVFGTNTGKVFVEFAKTEGDLKGTLRFNDDQLGPVVYEIAGTFEGGNLNLQGEPIKTAREGVVTGPIEIRGSLTPEGQVRGTWSSEMIGTGGSFILHSHDLPISPQPRQGVLPERLHTATRPLGTIRLYQDDLTELINFIGRDFNQPNVVVTYLDRGNEISRYSSDFMADGAKPDELRYLKLTAQEPEAYGINRVVMVELNAKGMNEVRSQGVQESWVVGKAEAVASFLREREERLATTFRRLGLNFNGFFILAAIVFLPELPLGRRIIFMVAVLLIAWAVMQTHERVIPNALIYTSPKKAGALRRAWPEVLSWLIAATATLAGAAAYGLLKGEVSWSFW